MTESEVKKVMFEVLSEAGLISPYISRSEIIRQVGRARYDRAVKAGFIRRNKAKGKNSKVSISRSEFMSCLFSGSI